MLYKIYVTLFDKLCYFFLSFSFVKWDVWWICLHIRNIHYRCRHLLISLAYFCLSHLTMSFYNFHIILRRHNIYYLFSVFPILYTFSTSHLANTIVFFFCAYWLVSSPVLPLVQIYCRFLFPTWLLQLPNKLSKPTLSSCMRVSPIGNSVAFQWEDNRPWVHGAIVSNGNFNHNFR